MESGNWAVLSLSKRKLLESDLNELWPAGASLSGKIMGEKEKNVSFSLG
jgi:hypothetical protein